MEWTEILEDEDERYLCYKPKYECDVFGKKVDSDDYEVFIKKDKKQRYINNEVLINYLKWLGSCIDVVKRYIEELSGELLTEEWKDSIEIYSVDVTFNDEEDYGATISFGECIYQNHIVEIDFEKEKIVDNRFNG